MYPAVARPVVLNLPTGPQDEYPQDDQPTTAVPAGAKTFVLGELRLGAVKDYPRSQQVKRIDSLLYRLEDLLGFRCTFEIWL